MLDYRCVSISWESKVPPPKLPPPPAINKALLRDYENPLVSLNKALLGPAISWWGGSQDSWCITMISIHLLTLGPFKRRNVLSTSKSTPIPTSNWTKTHPHKERISRNNSNKKTEQKTTGNVRYQYIYILYIIFSFKTFCFQKTFPWLFQGEGLPNCYYLKASILSCKLKSRSIRISMKHVEMSC